MAEVLPERLTRRESDILARVAAGASNADIAQQLILSTETVKWYVKQLYGKLGASSRGELIARAVALGLAAGPVSPLPHGAPAVRFINPLPQDIAARYVGNRERLATAGRLLREGARLISIYGRAGAGKTALACRALSELAGGSHDELSVITLSAGLEGITLLRVLADLGRALPEPDQATVAALARNLELTPAQKSAFLLEKIAGRRIVLLLDNLESIQESGGALAEPGLQQFVEMCVRQSGALTIIITSRQPLALPRELRTWEHMISLEEGLPSEDAVALLRRFDPSGRAGLRDAPAAELAEVAGRVGGFPRALESIAGMLLDDPLLSLANLRRDIDKIEGEVTAGVVQDALARLDSEAMKVLAALAVFGRPTPYDALAFLISPFMDEVRLRSLLGRLITACFVKSNRETGELNLHPIDQAYCYEWAASAGEGDARRREAGAEPFTQAALHRRAVAYYLAKMQPQSDWKQLADLEPQIAAIEHLARAGDKDEAARLLLQISRDYLREWGYHDLLRDLIRQLGGAADPHFAFQLDRESAWLKFLTAPTEADAEFAALLDRARSLRLVKEEADALDDLGQTCRRNYRDLAQAVAYHEQALALYQKIRDYRGEADAAGGLGAVYTLTAPEDALEYLTRAALIHRAQANWPSLSFAGSMLGAAYQHLGVPELASKNFRAAIDVARESGSLPALSRACSGLACLLIEGGDIEGGEQVLMEAREATRALSGVHVTGSLIFWVGQAAIYMVLAGHASRGIHLLEQTVAEAASSVPQLVPFGNLQLSLVLTLAGEYARARSLLPLDLASRPVAETATASWLGALLVLRGEREEARALLERFLSGARGAGRLATPAPLGQEAPAALALSALALLDQDEALAVQAAAGARKAGRVRAWTTRAMAALVEALAQTPGGSVLDPVLAVFRGWSV